MAWFGIAAPQIVRRHVMVEAATCESRVEIGRNPAIQIEGIAPLDAGAGRGAARGSDARIAVEYQFRPQFQQDHIERRLPIRDDRAGPADFRAYRTRERCDWWLHWI